MKKLLFLVILLSFSLQGYTQEKETDSTAAVKPENTTFKGVKYGVRGGYNISNLDFDAVSSINNKHRNSVYIGFFANIGLSKTVSVMPEIQFSAEGAKEETLHLDYIQAPIFFKFRLSEKIHIGAGPQVGLKVHKYEDGIRNFAYSGLAGVEYKINLMLFADVRYTYGFSNIFDDYLGISAKNSNIQIGIGYKF